MKLLQGSTQEKILGTAWNHAKHVLLLNVNPPNDIILTKRTVLSQIARMAYSSWVRSSLSSSRQNRNAAFVATRLRMWSRAVFTSTGSVGSFLPKNGRPESRDLWKIPYPSVDAIAVPILCMRLLKPGIYSTASLTNMQPLLLSGLREFVILGISKMRFTKWKRLSP